MTYVLRFFDDYGSGWLWAGNDAAYAAFDVGPLDDVLANRLSAATRAEAAALSELHATTLNMDEPQSPPPLSAGFCTDFNTRATALLAMIRADLGADFTVTDRHAPLRPHP